MPRVICRSPNASTLISGVKFEPHPDGGMLSEEIDEQQVARFLKIPGYAAADVKAPEPPKQPAPPAPETETPAPAAPEVETPPETETPADQAASEQKTEAAEKPAGKRRGQQADK